MSFKNIFGNEIFYKISHFFRNYFSVIKKNKQAHIFIHRDYVLTVSLTFEKYFILIVKSENSLSKHLIPCYMRIFNKAKSVIFIQQFRFHKND